MLVLEIFGVLYCTTPNARVGGLRRVGAGAVVALVAWIVAFGGKKEPAACY